MKATNHLSCYLGANAAPASQSYHLPKIQSSHQWENVFPLRFEDAAKNEIPTVINGNVARLTITGVGDQVAYPIYAVETGDTVKLAGKLNIVSYNPKPIKLVIVPVNGATNYPFAPDSLALATELQKIFQPALVDLSLSIALNFNTDDFDDELDAVATGFLQSYTGEMKDIYNAYDDVNDLDDDTYYIFLLPRFADSDQLGYMPRKRQFGFVNHEQLQSTQEPYVKTLAHELAHGAFVLHHTFEQHPQLEGNPTQNLLDYSATGTITHQYQWAGMHDPSKAWTLFDDDEDRANYVSGFEYFKNYGFGLNQDSSFNFITPAWQYIILPKETKKVTVYFGIYAYTHDDPRLEGELLKIPGTLESFEINGEKFTGRFIKSDGCKHSLHSPLVIFRKKA